jgi:multidrug resistance efflux pump
MKSIGGSYRSGRLHPHILPVLVWLAAAVSVGMLFHHRSQRFEVLGIAQGNVREIAATCTGRLKSVPVQLFEEVHRGDVVAIINTVLDNEHLEAELATTSAEVQHLQAELAHTQEALLAEAANLETDRIVAQRRFSVDVENARLHVLELKTLLETDRMTLEDLQLNNQIFITRNISDQNDVAHYERQKMKVEYNVLAKKIEENEHLLAQAESDLEHARQRHDEFARRQLHPPPVDSALEVIRRAIKVQEQRMEELLARRTELVLKSPIDGVVSQILRRPVRRTGEGVVRQMMLREGEAVLEGDPILTVAESKTSEVIAWVKGERLGWVREGMTVELIKENKPAQIANSQVTYVGPIMEVMPQQLWAIPDIPEWGRPMLIPIPPGLNLIPGETVGVRGL